MCHCKNQSIHGSPSHDRCHLCSVQIGRIISIASGEDLRALETGAPTDGVTVLDMAGWRIIPAENLVAAFQVHPEAILPASWKAGDTSQ